MEKILKNLPNLLEATDIEELSNFVKNPDSFTIQSMTAKQSKDFSLNFSSTLLGKPNQKLIDLFDGLDYRCNLDELIFALRKSDNEEVLEVATFIESNLKSLENISIEERSLPAILWATVVYKYISDSKTHVGIRNFDDIYENLPKNIAHALADACIENDEENTVEEIRKEVFSIFEKTSLADDVKSYFATAFLENKILADDLDAWFDNENFKEITLSTKSYQVNNAQSLRDALLVPTANSYQQAIDYVANKYFADCENNFNVDPDDLKNYKAQLVVGLLASNIIPDSKYEEFGIVDFNLGAKIILSKEEIDSQISLSHIAIGISLAKEYIMIDIVNDAKSIALDIMKELSPSDPIIDQEIVEEEIVEEIVEQNTSKIKYGDKRAYVDGYLKLFDSLVQSKVKYYKLAIKSLYQVKSAKGEELVNDLANQFNIELQTEEAFSNKNLRTVENAKAVAQTLRSQLKDLSIIYDIFKKVKSKKKDIIDIDNISFDKQMLGENFYITEESHKEIIREFYNLIAEDPILKNAQANYRLAPLNMNKMTLKERSSKEPQKYPFFSSALGLYIPSKKDEREQIVDKLYVNEDGTLNEDFENLYNTITDSKASAELKKLAVLDAKESGLLSEEDFEKLFALLSSKKKKVENIAPMADQLSFDFGSSENGTENE